MTSKHKEEVKYALYYIDENGHTKYLKSFSIRSMKYKKDKYYFKFTSNVVEAKTWNTQNGVYRMCTYCMNPYIIANHENVGELRIKEISKRLIRIEKLKKLEIHE